MSTETKEEVKIARKIKQLEKKIRHDSGYLSDDPDGSGARAVAKMEEELSQLQINQLKSQLAQLTRERDLAREGCRLGVEALGKLEKDFNILSHPGQRMIILQASNRMEALAMGKEK